MRTRRQTPTDLIYCVTTSRRRKTTPTLATTRRVLLECLCQLFGLLLSDLYFVVYFYRGCVCLSVCLSQSGIVSKRGLTLYGLIKTAQQRTLYSNTVIGTLAVDGWAVTFGTSTGLGGLRPRPVPSSMYQT